jgi:hypothetical protein
MATALKLRRGTTSQHSTFTGAEGELTVDTTKDTAVVHDGTTAGGFPLVTENTAQTVSGAKTFTGANAFNGTLGATTPAAGTFTSLSDSGNLTFTGTGNRITGDFSNATIASRVAFQNSVVDAVSRLLILPNGTATSSSIDFSNNSDTNSILSLRVGISSTEAQIQSTRLTGASTYLPMTFYTGGSEHMRIDTSGNVGIGTSSPSTPLHVRGAQPQATITGNTGAAAQLRFYNNAASTNDFLIGQGYNTGSDNVAFISNQANADLLFRTNGAERMRIDTSGNLLFNSGYGSVATAYGCRAWVRFNGIGTVAIIGSGNVSSISDIGTGLYRINFATSMPDTNFTAVGNCAQADSNQNNTYGDFITFYSYDATDVNISTLNDSNSTASLADMENVTAAIFR